MCYFLHRKFQVSTFSCEGGHYVTSHTKSSRYVQSAVRGRGIMLLPTPKVPGKQIQHGGGGRGISSSCVSFHTRSSR